VYIRISHVYKLACLLHRTINLLLPSSLSYIRHEVFNSRTNELQILPWDENYTSLIFGSVESIIKMNTTTLNCCRGLLTDHTGLGKDEKLVENLQPHGRRLITPLLQRTAR
jgi:hypothetical protein